VFGEDAALFNPRREIPRGVPPYGVAFGSGAHMCIGLRVVLGNDGAGGAHVHVLRGVIRAGARLDPDRQPEKMPGERGQYVNYPAVFPDWDPTLSDPAVGIAASVATKQEDA
jgi:hypothetical protein